MLADERVAKYMRNQKLLEMIVNTRIGKILFGKRLFRHEDIVKRQNELLNNLFGNKLDRVDFPYIDALFLLYSKRKNKAKRPNDLCMKRFYDVASKKLQKNEFDIVKMQVNISPSRIEEEKIFLSLPEYLNLLENIRMEFKKVNTDYEKQAKNQVSYFDDEEVFTDFQAHSPADEIRNKKIEICAKDYDTIIETADISTEFSDLCRIFYLAFKSSKSLEPIKKILESDMDSYVSMDDIFSDDVSMENLQQRTISLENLLTVFENLSKENTSNLHLRSMYDIS